MEWTMRQAQSLWSVTGEREPDVETAMKVLWLGLPRSGTQASHGSPLLYSKPLEIFHMFFQAVILG